MVIARGKRLVPFRTQKLRLFAPMVLHFCGCGRVGHRRFIFEPRTPCRKTWGSLYIRVCQGNTAGCTPGYMHGEIQRSTCSICSASSLPFSSPPKKQTIAARQSKTLGGRLSLIKRSLTPLAAPQKAILDPLREGDTGTLTRSSRGPPRDELRCRLRRLQHPEQPADPGTPGPYGGACRRYAQYEPVPSQRHEQSLR